MNKFATLAAACAVALAACGTHEPTNEELTTLLHREGTPAGDANAALDAPAVMCLRTWSGDTTLTATLPPAVLADSAKGRCRARLDGWIADAARNPGKFEFDDVSKPDVVKRAMNLLDARTDPKTLAVRKAAEEPRQHARVAADAGPPPDIDTALTAATTTCQKAKDITATNKQDMRLYRYAEFCDKNIADTRAQVTQLKLEGSTAKIEQIAKRVDHMTKAGDRLIGNPQKQ